MAAAGISRRLPLARVRGLLVAGDGLTNAEALARRARHGPNDIVEVPTSPWWELARETARDPMIWFLAATALLYRLIGDRFEAVVLLAAIAPLVGMDALLHRRTRASTGALRGRLAARATVVRDGRAGPVPAVDLVPGDLVLVDAGETFPADGVMVDGEGLQADESLLTGEAHPIRKRPLPPLPPGAEEPTVTGTHWGLAGTRLLTGRASLRVVFTGSETVYGEIVRSAALGARARTPLQAAIAELVAVLVVVAAVLCLILAVVRVRQGHGWVDALVSAATLAVAALPEEFPVVFTFFLGVGVYRLATRQALVRRAVSVENIGRTTCVCTDKTGTLTEGRLHLTHLIPVPGMPEEHLHRLAALASRPESGDPLDTAVATTGIAAEPVAVFPFTERRRRETTVAREASGALVAATKGAVETVLAMCSLSAAERHDWQERGDELAREGHKVIACAARAIDAGTWPGGEPDRGYGFAGLLAFEDPVREGVAQAIARCRAAGIHIIMVTGDHPATARAVAGEIGLGDGTPHVITGDEMEAQFERDGGRALRRVDAIARALPDQKLALVRGLQAAGEVVVLTGDGVNDVPGLQAADIGIAMGRRGSRSAREAAAIVLLDDDFRTIVGAVAEGRQLFRNLQRSFQYLLMIHAPLLVTAALLPLAGYPLLYLPVHIAWLELLIHPTAVLVFQDLPPAHDLLVPAAPPRRARFFSPRDWALMGVVAALLTLAVVAGYVRGLGDGAEVAHARAAALAVLTLASATLVAALTGLRTRIARLVAAATTLLSVVLVQTPALATLLHVEPLHLDDWVGAGIASLLAVVPILGAARARR